MTNKSFAYIHIDRQEGVVTTSGIAFKEFCAGLEHKPANLLILDANCVYWNLTRPPNVFLDHVPFEEIERDIRDISIGNFCWVDFADVADLDRVTKQELAELLYFNHMVKPFNHFQIASLRNRFAYHGHDDDWSVRIFMENPDDYRAVVAYKLVKELKGRKRTMPPPPVEVMDRLMGMFEDGAAIDFEQANLGEGYAGVDIYPIGDCWGDAYGMDVVHEKLDRQRKCYAGEHLEYDTRGKRWRFY
jgi:hypothetical protein